MSEYFDNKQLFSSPKVSQYGSHMVMTNVVKESKFKHINIDTKFSDDYVNNRTNTNNIATYNAASYTFTLSEKINDVKSISVVNAEIPILFYNISAAQGNNCFLIRSDYNVSTTYSQVVTVPDGQYSASSLVTQINTLLTGLVNQLTNLLCTLDASSNRVTIKMGGGVGNFYVDFAVNTTGDFDKFSVKSKLGWLLGYRGISYRIDTTTGVKSESTVNVNGTKYLYLAIDEFSKGNDNSFISPVASSLMSNKNLAKISMDRESYPYGTIQISSINNGLLISDTRGYNGKVDIQRLNIKLVDENGVTVYLNGGDFSFCLQVEYE
jgi:hypothetical protein